MTRRFSLAVPFVALLSLPSAALAQSWVTLDLAGPTAQTIPAPGSEIQFVIVNRLPLLDYRVQVIDRVMDVKPFDKLGGANVAGTPTGCDAAVQTAKDLTDLSKMNGKSEADVKKMIVAIRKDMGACDDAKKKAIDAEIAKTRQEVESAYRVGDGHEIVLIVTRQDGDKTLTWTLIVQGAARGQWLTTYGMVFVQDKDEKFFSQSTGDKEFTITAEEKRKGFKPLPTVFFSWIPRSRQDREYFIRPTGGIGLEGGNRPAIFGGVTFTYNWNLGVVLGVGGIPETRLTGMYSAGQKLTENLAADALHSTVWRARVFIAGTFRFGANPFASTGAASEVTGEKKADPKKKE